MIPLAILLVGLLLVLLVSVVLLVASGMSSLVLWLFPAILFLVMTGSGMLILIEMLLFLGGKEDRRKAKQDLGLLIPTCVASGIAWYIAAFALGLWR